jgi:hypothetical protein
MEQLVESLRIPRLSKSQVSVMADELDALVHRTRPPGGPSALAGHRRRSCDGAMAEASGPVPVRPTGLTALETTVDSLGSEPADQIHPSRLRRNAHRPPEPAST